MPNIRKCVNAGGLNMNVMKALGLALLMSIGMLFPCAGAETTLDGRENQYAMLGGEYTLTVSSTEVIIDAHGGIMRVLSGNTWQPVTAGRYVLTKPENINHGVIFFEDGEFALSSASAYIASKTAEKSAVGIVYWDMDGQITKYEINGDVSDTRSPSNGGEIIRDVHWFGAKGDGLSDDTAAFQAALDACQNGILYIPNGTYLVSKTLYIHSNTHIIGNKGYTVIQLKTQEENTLDELLWRPEVGRNKFPFVRTDDASTGIIIEGLIFRGDTVCFHDLQQNGLYITGSHHVIRDCSFVDWNYFPDKWESRMENASAWGLAICHAKHITVQDCHFARNGYEGAGTEYSDDVHFRGCYFGAAMRTALQIHRASTNITLEGCTLNNDVDSDNTMGDYATMTFHGAPGAIIDGVKITNCDFRHRHIQCVAGYERNVQISNCRFYSDSNRFVVITMGASGNIPQNTGWQIVGNTFFSLANGGVTTVHMNVDASMVTNNILHTNADTPVVMNGTNNMEANNLIVPID